MPRLLLRLLPLATALGTAHAATAAFQLSINGRVVSVEASGVDETTARAMLQAMGRNAVPPADPRRRNGQRAHCVLSGDASDPLVARMELHCNGWQVVFVRLCPQQRCRYDLVSRQYLPARAR